MTAQHQVGESEPDRDPITAAPLLVRHSPAAVSTAVDAAVPASGGTAVEQPPRVRQFPWVAVTAMATAVAGGLHLAAAVEHVDAGDLVVAFFGLTGFGQLAAAVALLVPLAGPSAVRTRHLLALAGLVATAALVVLYVVAHSTDLFAGLLQHPGAAGHDHASGVVGHSVATEGPVPLGAPAPAGPEPVDGLGTATVAAELLAVCGFLALLPAAWRRRAADALLLLGGLAWAAWLGGWLT